MFDANHIDTQPLYMPQYIQEYSYGSPTQPIGNRNFGLEQTPIQSNNLGLILRVSSKTPFSTDLEIDNISHSFEQEFDQSPEPEIDPQLIAARDARLSLLVQKFEGDSNRENDARLEILTQRLRRLNPVITPEILGVFTELTTDLESISSNIDELTARFGLN